MMAVPAEVRAFLLLLVSSFGAQSPPAIDLRHQACTDSRRAICRRQDSDQFRH